ncbi:MAG: hypothetical protein WBC02_03710 [Candidatus Aminicenantaceae bacterium]|nr:hypothetical protein [Candidatus Aminicenantes bacterium]
MGVPIFKKNKIYFFGIILWLFAISTPLIFQYMRNDSFKRKHKQFIENSKKYKSFYHTLSKEQKDQMYYLNLGLIKSNENDFLIVENQKIEEIINNNKIIVKKIDYKIIDIRKLVLQSAVKEIRAHLNEAENALISDFYGVILTNENDEFFLVFNSEIYPKYASKYGTECKSCNK